MLSGLSDINFMPEEKKAEATSPEQPKGPESNLDFVQGQFIAEGEKMRDKEMAYQKYDAKIQVSFSPRLTLAMGRRTKSSPHQSSTLHFAERTLGRKLMEDYGHG